LAFILGSTSAYCLVCNAFGDGNLLNASFKKSVLSINGKNDYPDSIENKKPEHFKYAVLFNIPVEFVNNLHLFRFLYEWYGTRYLFGGTSKEGIDCSAFIQRLMNDVFFIKLSKQAELQFRQSKEIQKSELQQGDLVFFHTGRQGLSHVGFYLGDNKFIHASVNKGVCIDDLDDTYYKNAYRNSGRVLSIE
jgi:lipoprotein Spr